MTEPADGVPAADLTLLVQLAAVARTADPAPELVLELGRAALGTRRVDAELAELVADELRAAAGVRAAAVDRELAFELPAAARLTVGVAPAAARDQVALEGWLDPAPSAGGIVRLERLGAATRSSPLHDITGSFRFDAVPTGPARLHVEVAGQTPVTTTWVVL